MSTQLGKRKRRKDLDDKGKTTEDLQASGPCLQQLLQKHFEASYAPLQVDSVTVQVGDEVSCSSSESTEDGWEGIHDDEEPETVEVVTHEGKDETDCWREKQERRLFMSSKPPAQTIEKSSLKKQPKDNSTMEDENETKNLKNDMALQRLLQESSMLRSARTDARGTMPSAVHPSDDPGSTSLALRGTDRHKAVDLRLQSLGAKGSLFKQKKMPLNHRLGIVGKQRSREKERRRDARENGIILEKSTPDRMKRQRPSAKLDRGVGGPGLGRMKGGTLVLSQRDVRSIQGSATKEGTVNKGRRRR